MKARLRWRDMLSTFGGKGNASDCQVNSANAIVFQVDCDMRFERTGLDYGEIAFVVHSLTSSDADWRGLYWSEAKVGLAHPFSSDDSKSLIAGVGERESYYAGTNGELSEVLQNTRDD